MRMRLRILLNDMMTPNPTWIWTKPVTNCFILDDSLTPTSNAAKQEFQNIANVLAGGTVLHPDLDLGYGPAMVVDKEAIEKALEEFKKSKL
jgi:hypothetical protein